MKKIVLSAAFVLFAFSFALPARAAVIDKIAAGVNSDVILMSDVERFQRTVALRKELDPLFGFTGDLEDAKMTRAKVIDFLIQEQLILQAFKVTDAEVEQEIQSVQKNNNLNRDDLTKFLREKGYTYEDYFYLMRVGLAKRSLLDREIRSRVSISDDDVKNYYYNTVVKNSSVPLEYSLQLITISNSSYKTPALAQTTADGALRSIRQGEPFAEVARRVSDDPSAEQGGELGYLAGDQLAGPLRTSAKSLQIGAVSDVIKTPTGFIIIKLLDARSAETQKFVEAKEKIRESLAKDEYKKQLHLWAERARNNAYVYLN